MKSILLPIRILIAGVKGNNECLLMECSLHVIKYPFDFYAELHSLELLFNIPNIVKIICVDFKKKAIIMPFYARGDLTKFDESLSLSSLKSVVSF